MAYEPTVTEQEFRAYLLVQKRGAFNMLTESNHAQEMAGLDRDTYWAIINNYGKLQDKYATTYNAVWK